jgi:serine/threonine protein kinase
MKDLYNNQYEYIKTLGEGGFGRVFLAIESKSRRKVAIKELIDVNDVNQQGIIHEIQHVAKFNHPHIVNYYHHFEEDGYLFLVMEYCEKGTLAIQNCTVDEIIEYIKQVSIALGELHQKNIIHHDIKPNNLLLTLNKNVKIADFGMANKSGGTKAYMSPEMLQYERTALSDERVDIYALGVTLMELLTGTNPFYYKSKEEIIEIHHSKNFPIQNLSSWQQEVILKAIHIIPELRFQTMVDFTEALALRQVPIFLNKHSIMANNAAEKMTQWLKAKKWSKVISNLEYLQSNFPTSVNVLKVLGDYHLSQNNIKIAKKFYDEALSLNPRIDIQKELAIINIALGNYPIAISLISDYLHRNSSDMEAYNLLLQCYYETNRYEAGINLGKTILSVEKNNSIIANNYYLCHIMLNMPNAILPNSVLAQKDNPFIDYNMGVCFETPLSHSYDKNPTLKSKLLFADYRFHKMQIGDLHFADDNPTCVYSNDFPFFIIKLGRKGYDVNTIEVEASTAVSRRHCLIINAKDDCWLYDLYSTGVFLNGVSVESKIPIIGLNTLRIHNTEIKLTSDKSKLL